jgi:hypothetical protein
LIFNEETWTEKIAENLSFIEWEQLNPCDGMSFGLTNLAYVEKVLETGRYPLIDHTCLYQGQIQIDETGAIEKFRTLYYGVQFSNIVSDYLRQTEWRVTQKLPREINSISARFIKSKYALPVVHTCYRIVRDLANIANYHEHGVYLCDNKSLLSYYTAWPWFEPSLQKLQLFKMNEAVRRAVFNEVIEGKTERIEEIKNITSAVVILWEQFQERYRQIISSEK